jgi:hypothetical protein
MLLDLISGEIRSILRALRLYLVGRPLSDDGKGPPEHGEEHMVAQS